MVTLAFCYSSFILGLYNTSGDGQRIDEETIARINSIDKELDIKVIVTLACSMCPELVVSSQKIASVNKNVKAHIYDVNYFEDLKKKYNVMSVPCLVINDTNVSFGKKNIQQLLDHIESL